MENLKSFASKIPFFLLAMKRKLIYHYRDILVSHGLWPEVVKKRKDYNDEHRQFLLILPMCIDHLNQMRYNTFWQY